MPAIREIVKGITLQQNEPEWLARALFEEEVSLGVEYDQFDYVAFAENGDIYGINGSSEDKEWMATLHEKITRGDAKTNKYEAVIAVKEVKPGGLSIRYKTRKALLAAIEEDSLQFLKKREPDSYANEVSYEETYEEPNPSSSSAIEKIPSKVEYGLSAPKVNPARPKIRRSRGVKRVGAALLLALIGIFTPGMSLLIVPLLISGSESVLKEQSSLGHKSVESSMAWVLLGAGVICGLIGIFSPVFSFLCAIFICQSYNMRCKDMYARMNK